MYYEATDFPKQTLSNEWVFENNEIRIDIRGKLLNFDPLTKYKVIIKEVKP